MLLSGESVATTDLPPLHIQWCTLQAQLDDGLVEFSSISSDASVDQLRAGFLKLAHGAHTEDQETVIQHIQHILIHDLHVPNFIKLQDLLKILKDSRI